MYKKITVTTTTKGSDAVADAFWSIGVDGVEILDPQDLQDVLHGETCWDYVDEGLLDTSKPVTVSSFVEESELSAKLAELGKLLRAIEPFSGAYDPIVTDVEDVDWENDWKKYYKPITAGKYTVMPDWLMLEHGNADDIVYINPLMAFGTGEHESTRLCLRLMSQSDFNGKIVADVGTGSGILGIAAKKSGAKSVFMCDIDKDALKCASDNAEFNGVGDVEIVCGGAEVCERKNDIVLANLTADILEKIVDAISKITVEGGTLICSGILDTREEDLVACYSAHGYKVVERIAEGEWVGIKFTYGA